MKNYKEWMKVLENSKNGNITHLPAYGKMMEKVYKKKVRFWMSNDKNTIALICKRSYPKFPILNYAQVGDVLGSFCYIGEKPDLSFTDEMGNFLTYKCHVYVPVEDKISLEGWKKGKWYRWLIRINNKEKMWENLHKHCRNSIRKAIKNECSWEITNRKEDVEDFIVMMEEMQERIRKTDPRIYGPKPHDYRKILKILRDNSSLVAVKKNDELMSAFILMHYKHEAYYTSPVSSEDAYKISANNLMVWGALEWCSRNNIRVFNFSGVNPDPADKKGYGVYKFKSSFGGFLHQLDHFTRRSGIFQLIPQH